MLKILPKNHERVASVEILKFEFNPYVEQKPGKRALASYEGMRGYIGSGLLNETEKETREDQKAKIWSVS